MHFKETLFAGMEGGDAVSEVSFLSLADQCGFGLRDCNVAPLGSKLGEPGHEDTASTLSPPEQTCELCSLGCAGPTPGKGEPRPLPLSEILQRSQSRICTVPRCCSALMAPGGQGLLEKSRREESQALLQGSFAGRRSSQYYLLKN